MEDELVKAESISPATPEPEEKTPDTESATAAKAASPETALEAARQELETLRAKLEEVEQRNLEHLKARQQTEASFASYRRRVEAERAEWTWQANARLLASLLPMLDDFERAAQTMPEALQALSWTGGLWLIRRKLEWLLETEGVKPISVTRGEAFDPYRHEAVVQQETDTVPEGHIVSEVQRGYIWNDRVVLRPALVSVARASTPATPPTPSPTTEETTPTMELVQPEPEDQTHEGQEDKG